MYTPGVIDRKHNLSFGFFSRITLIHCRSFWNTRQLVLPDKHVQEVMPHFFIKLQRMCTSAQ